VKAAAETFRQNPKLNTETVLTELAVGEALVSMLEENGSPQIVERAKIVPPRSQLGAITADQRKQIISSSVLAGHYEKAIDRESAYEKLQARAGQKTESAGAPPVTQDQPSTTGRPQSSILADALGTVTAAFQPTIGPRGAVHDSVATSMAKSAMRAASSQLGRQVIRGLLGGILGGGGSRRR
jgi:DNA helicase HerA-like ATPase